MTETKGHNIKLYPIYTNEDLKEMFNVKSLDSIITKLNTLGITYSDEGSGKGRMITVWLDDIMKAKPEGSEKISRYEGAEDYFKSA